MKKTILTILFAACFSLPQVHAYTVNATLTADNHYGLYYGNVNASNLTLVGRNEFGPYGAGGYNWSLPESYSFNTGNDRYLYVLAWDDQMVTQSWIGQFSGPQFGTIYSNTTNWQYMMAHGPNPGDYGNLPTLSTVKNDIATASWAQALASAPNGTQPWGNIPGISPDADFVWPDTFDNASISDPHYVIFRGQILPDYAVVPEPATWALLGGGLLMVWFFRRKFNIV